jgi:hypothetical protein
VGLAVDQKELVSGPATLAPRGEVARLQPRCCLCTRARPHSRYDHGTMVHACICHAVDHGMPTHLPRGRTAQVAALSVLPTALQLECLRRGASCPRKLARTHDTVYVRCPQAGSLHEKLPIPVDRHHGCARGSTLRRRHDQLEHLLHHCVDVLPADVCARGARASCNMQTLTTWLRRMHAPSGNQQRQQPILRRAGLHESAPD